MEIKRTINGKEEVITLTTSEMREIQREYRMNHIEMVVQDKLSGVGITKVRFDIKALAPHIWDTFCDSVADEYDDCITDMLEEALNMYGQSLYNDEEEDDE